MFRDAVGYTCEVKTAQETVESGGISRNHWEIGEKFWGNSGKIGEFRRNSGGIGGKFWGISGKIGEFRGKLGENWLIVFPQW